MVLLELGIIVFIGDALDQRSSGVAIVMGFEGSVNSTNQLKVWVLCVPLPCASTVVAL